MPRFPRAGTLAGLALPLLAAAVGAAEVRFEVNDAQVKDRPVAGVRILVAAAPGGDPVATAETDAGGVATVELAPGTYWVSYARSGYVPIGDSETAIRGGGQVVTTTLSMLLEAEGGGAERRVRVVLNWGSEPSDVRDADAHAYCSCGAAGEHVYFAAMRHEGAGHVLALDVDDRDWGGPETVTLSDPPPGAYRYWVHQYSRDEDTLGASDVVVRVLFDDAMAGEFRVPPDLAERTWRPFREIAVGPDGRPELVRFAAGELTAGADREPPPDRLSVEGPPGGGCVAWLPCAVVVTIVVLAGLAARRRRR